MVCEDGELGSIQRLPDESLVLHERVQRHTAMVGKQSSLGVVGAGAAPEDSTTSPARSQGAGAILSWRLSAQLETTDNYVQFVHFTVKEYLTSPSVPGYISSTDATRSLAMCCVLYLTQENHTMEVEDEDMACDIHSGSYAFYHFAARTWCELTITALTETTTQRDSQELIRCLKSLVSLKRDPKFEDKTTYNDITSLRNLKSEHKDLYDTLCQLNDFNNICSRSDYHLRKAVWGHLDPLTISETSVRVHEALSQITSSQVYQLDKNGNDQVLLKWHGPLPFHCGYLSCISGRYGFESPEKRRIHENNHDRPWKCRFSDCLYAEGGFGSLKMRDDHLDHFHKESGDALVAASLEVMEESFIFDLARTNQAASIKTILPEFLALNGKVQGKILETASLFGSVETLEILVEGLRGEEQGVYDDPNMEMSRISLYPKLAVLKTSGVATTIWGTILRLLLEVKTTEGFAHLLPIVWKYTDMAKLLASLLSLECYEEAYHIWKPYGLLDFKSGYMYWTESGKRPQRTSNSNQREYTDRGLFLAVAGNPLRESLLIEFWEDTHMFEGIPDRVAAKALAYAIRSETSSTKLMHYIVDCGAPVNFPYQNDVPYCATAPEDLSLSASASTNPERNLDDVEKCRVLRIFDSADGQVVLSAFAEPSLRIRSKLMRHQLHAIAMMTERKSNIIGDPKFPSLWITEHTTQGLQYRHIITGAINTIPVQTGGGLLADDVGLGKTLTTLALICSSLDSMELGYTKLNEGETRATLVITPKSKTWFC
ncbi:uncharacterized protein PG986_004610 [Apiospora aurea]|uniref:SNF2 N-terminal domain-containing protein n=1 Tax=Apiospora aurea TaxID=335848 RepID=A0ABR1QNF9_9PEZI